MTIQIKKDDRGRKAVLVDSWGPGDGETLRRSGVTRLQLVVRGPDLEFLKDVVSELDGIEELQLVNHVLSSDGGASALSNLRALGLETYSKDRIDFAQSFPKIERLSFNWRPSGGTAFDATTLKSLSISGYPLADLNPLARLGGLHALRLDNSRHLRSLSGVEGLDLIRILSLRDDRALTDIGRLSATHHSLSEFELNACRKVTDITALERHRDLRRVVLIDCGRITSIGPLVDLPELEEFWFYGTTVIDDGDMTPLLRMAALKRVSFAPRSHYTHRTEDIERLRHIRASTPLPHWQW